MTERHWENFLDDSADVAGPDWALERGISVAKICLARASPVSRGSDDFTVYTGAAGMAYMCLVLATAKDMENDSKLLFLRMGCEYLQSISLPTNRKSLRHIGPSLLCGHAGVHLVNALFSNVSSCNTAPYRIHVQAYLELMPVVTDPHFDADEFLYGRAGYLYGLMALQSEFGETLVSDECISSVAYSIVVSGRNYVQEGRLHRRGQLPPMFWEWHSKHYLGAAHGAFGIIYSLLVCSKKVFHNDMSVMREIVATLDFLLSLWIPSLSNFPTKLELESKTLVHWCHGASGAVFALCEAYKVFGQQQYLDAAIQAGETVWKRGLLKKGPGLCHGIAGNAYALLALFKVTSDSVYLRRAHRFAEYMGGSEFAQVALNPDNPYSLFEGLSGAACLYADLADPERSRFPLFEL